MKSNVNDENISNLVKSIYMTYLNARLHSCSQLYILVRQFAKAFGEEEEVKKLTKIWLGQDEKNIKRQIAIPTLELILYRDLTFNFKIGKSYNLGFNTKNSFTLGELNFKLQQAKQNIMDSFFKVYLNNNVSVGFQFPAFQQQENNMPSL